MSLICHECRKDLVPSDSLPGREGVFLYPNVLSRVWIAGDPQETENWCTVSVITSHSLAICFECMEKSAASRDLLLPVYETYQAETEYRTIEEEQRGRWVHPGDELWIDKYDIFKGKRKKIFPGCALCGSGIQSEKETHFTARAIDKANSLKSDISLFGSYIWSNAIPGNTAFKICFGCCALKLTRTFIQLSYDLRGVQKENLSEILKGPELYLAPSFVDMLATEMGEDRAEELMAGLPG